MFTHNLDPVLFDFGFLAIRWYSLAYIIGILAGWWLGKKIVIRRCENINQHFDIKKRVEPFDQSAELVLNLHHFSLLCLKYNTKITTIVY